MSVGVCLHYILLDTLHNLTFLVLVPVVLKTSTLLLTYALIVHVVLKIPRRIFSLSSLGSFRASRVSVGAARTLSPLAFAGGNVFLCDGLVNVSRCSGLS